MNNVLINLIDCKKGDTLVSQNGDKYTYLQHNPQQSFPHILIDSCMRKTSRQDNGQVSMHDEAPKEYDIVQVIPKRRRVKRISV
jgi:hypothetical protein